MKKIIVILFSLLISLNTFASKSHWNYGSGSGSKSHWNYGSGQGSKSHWNYGSGITFNASPLLDSCLGLMSSKSESPKSCIIYPNLIGML